jgi:hypothetical protein
MVYDEVPEDEPPEPPDPLPLTASEPVTFSPVARETRSGSSRGNPWTRAAIERIDNSVDGRDIMYK